MKRKLIQKITIAGLMLALILLIKMYFTIYIDIPVFPIQIGFDSMFLSINGMLLGPLYALIVGLLSDNLGFFLTNKSTAGYNPFFGITEVVCGLAGAFMVILCRKQNFRKNLKYITSAIYVILFIFAIYYIMSKETYKVNDVYVAIPYKYRVIAMAVLSIIFILSFIILFFFEIKKKANTSLIPFSGIFMIRIITEIANVFVNSLCLHIQYDLPLEPLMLVRVYKAIILIPIYSVMFYFILLAIERTSIINKIIKSPKLINEFDEKMIDLDVDKC